MTAEEARRALEIAAEGNAFTPACDVLSEKAFVNGMVGLNATGGSTNLTLHLVAMARTAGVLIDWQDMAEISAATPLIAKVYPNGIADVNHFHAAGGLQYMIRELLGAGLLHDDVPTVAGPGLSRYTQEPVLEGARLVWREGAVESGSRDILRGAAEPFQPTGGLRVLEGNLGRSVIKVSAVTVSETMRIAGSAKAATMAGPSPTGTTLIWNAVSRGQTHIIRTATPLSPNGMCSAELKLWQRRDN